MVPRRQFCGASACGRVMSINASAWLARLLRGNALHQLAMQRARPGPAAGIGGHRGKAALVHVHHHDVRIGRQIAGLGSDEEIGKARFRRPQRAQPGELQKRRRSQDGKQDG
jgi:hypothetical protein